MLLLLRDYLKVQQTANLQQIACYLKQSPELTLVLLEHWMAKGKVCGAAQPSGCGTRCRACRPEYAKIYRWMD